VASSIEIVTFILAFTKLSLKLMS